MASLRPRMNGWGSGQQRASSAWGHFDPWRGWNPRQIPDVVLGRPQTQIDPRYHVPNDRALGAFRAAPANDDAFVAALRAMLRR